MFAVTALTTILIMSIAKVKQILKTNTMNENRKKVVIIGGVIRKQLGWLVVWGNVVGALIGVATVLFAGYGFGA